MPNRALGSVLRKIRRLIGPPEGGRVSDRQLLERFATGREESAFAELVSRHGPMVLGIGRRVLDDEHDAQDAFQATFMVLMRKAGSVSWDESAAGWLYRVAFRAALKIKTSAVRRRAHETQAGAMPITAPHNEPAWRDVRGVLDEELSGLPEKYRAPLVLCYLHGKTSEEAARELGWPAGSMSRRLAKGRALLKDRLARRGVALALPVLLPLLGPERMLAAVPETLAAATVKSAVAASFSGAVSTLADALMKEMFLAKVKIAAAVVLMVGAAAGAGVLIHQAGSGNQADKTQIQASQPKLGPPPKVLQARELKLPHLETQVTAVAIMPDGKHFASGGSDAAIRLWNLQPGKEADRFVPHQADPKAGTSRIAFSADGRTFASAGWHGDGVVRLWTIGQAKETRQMHGDPGGIGVLAFTPKGESLLFSAAGGGLKLIDSRSGNERWTIQPDAHVDSANFSPDGKLLATAEGDGQVAIREPATGKELRRIPAGQTVFSGSQAVAFSPDSKTLATASMRAGSIRLWDPGTGQEVKKLGGDVNAMVTSTCYLRDGKLVAAAVGEAVRIFDIESGKEVFRLTADLNPRCPLAAHGTTLLAGGQQGTVYVWDIPLED